MYSRRLQAILLAGALLAVLGFVALAANHPGQEVHASTDVVNGPLPAPTHTHHTPISPSKIGIPSIPVKTGHSLTIGEVKSFVLSHRFIGGDPVSGAHPVVTLSEALTTSTYQSKYGVTLPLPASEPLILVRMSGPFHITNANAPEAAKAVLDKVPSPMVAEVFDASTGNLVEWDL